MSTDITEKPKAETKQLTIKQHLGNPALLKQIQAALPSHMTADRMARVALTAINKTPKLAQCTQESFFLALMTCSQLGLEPDGRLAHLIPYGNQCQLIIDYKGLVDLAYRSKQVTAIHAEVIYEGDEFEYSLGEVTKHVPWSWRQGEKPAERGRVLGAFCIIKMIDAEKHEVMTLDELDAIRERSQGYRKAKSENKVHPWISDWAEMAKKTVFKRASKWVPLSPEVRDAVNTDSDDFEPIQQTRTLTVDSIKHLADDVDADPLGG
jgi:recombination protein RecT